MHWLLTYSQRTGSQHVTVNAIVCGQYPSEWLIEMNKKYPDAQTVLLFALDISHKIDQEQRDVAKTETTAGGLEKLLHDLRERAQKISDEHRICLQNVRITWTDVSTIVASKRIVKDLEATTFTNAHRYDHKRNPS